MWIFELIGLVYDLAQAWRFSLCLVGGFGLGFLVVMQTGAGRFQTAIGIIIMVGFNLVGALWEMAARKRRPRP